jgi:hypothetical protein
MQTWTHADQQSLFFLVTAAVILAQIGGALSQAAVDEIAKTWQVAPTVKAAIFAIGAFGTSVLLSFIVGAAITRLQSVWLRMEVILLL